MNLWSQNRVKLTLRHRDQCWPAFSQSKCVCRQVDIGRKGGREERKEGRKGGKKKRKKWIEI